MGRRGNNYAKDYGYGYGYNYGYGYDYGRGYNTYGTGYNYGGYVGKGATTATTKPAEMTEEEKALFKAMANARSKVYKSYEEAIADENPKVDSFFPSPTGWMCLQRRKIDGNELIFIKKADKCPLIDVVEPKIEITVNNRIPKELLIEIVGSFARICNLNGNEAAAQIYREKDPAEGSTERKYVVYYPEQQISGAQVTYANDTGMLEMRKTHELVMELHSHNRMSAFWSGTDNANEKDCGFYMVIGTFGAASATYKCRVKYGDLYTDFPAHNIFDMTPEEEAEILKRENWTAGNPIIETRAKAHGSVHATATKPATTTTTPRLGNTTGGFNSGSLPENFMTRYNEFEGKVIPHTDGLYPTLMRCSKYNTTKRVYVCNSHAFGPSVYGDKDWHPIEETINPYIVGAYTYVEKLEAAFGKDGCLRNKPVTYDYSYAESGAATVSYLLGEAEDIDARRTSVPGKIGEYQGYNVPEYIPGLNDDSFREAVNTQALARVCAAENIQTALDINLGDVDVKTAEFNDDFRLSIANKLDGNIQTNVKPATVWELFTQMEKNRLSCVFGETVPELAKQFNALQNMVPEFLIFVFWATLVPDNYRIGLMNAVEVVRDVVETERKNNDVPGDMQIVQACNDMLAVNKDLFVDFVGYNSGKTTEQQGG